jgi:hypothetical protein
MSNFIKTKHPKEGENKEQKERTHVQARNKNGEQGGQVRGVGKRHAVNLIIIRSMLEKERGGTLKKTLSL